MPLDDNVKITPENCESLKNILDLNNPDEKEDFEFTEACTRIYLFSQFPERRDYAMRRLRDFYNPHTNIHTLDAEGAIWAYMSLTQAKDAFFLVETYKKDSPRLEPVPMKWEEQVWATE